MDSTSSSSAAMDSPPTDSPPMDTSPPPHQNGNNNNNNNNTPGNRFSYYYANWMAQQEEDLEELKLAMECGPENEENLREVADRVMFNFQEYIEKRSQHAQSDSPSLLCPAWSSSYVRSNLWMGGCRATMCIRLVHSLCGLEAQAAMIEYLRGIRSGNMADLSADQLIFINTLQAKTIKEEDRISSQMATLHENMTDDPFLGFVRYLTGAGEFNMDVQRAIQDHTVEMGMLLIEADKLRIDTLKHMLQILSPYQGIDLLLTCKKLHIAFPQWSRTRDQLIAMPFAPEA